MRRRQAASGSLVGMLASSRCAWRVRCCAVVAAHARLQGCERRVGGRRTPGCAKGDAALSLLRPSSVDRRCQLLQRSQRAVVRVDVLVCHAGALVRATVQVEHHFGREAELAAVGLPQRGLHAIT